MSRKILVTTALPYANGSIHLGHILEGVQADIWVRYQKSLGNECLFFCADDTHGTPIMLAAKKNQTTPEEYIKKVHIEHEKDLRAFEINYDKYYTTNSNENKELAEEIYNKLKSKGHISAREIEQTFCEHDNMFLPDRFIKGTCPKCNSKDQYGDNCEVCGSTYSPTDLKESYCAICGNTPILKFSKHLFFKLQDFEKPLRNWLSTPNRMHEGSKKKLLEWFDSGLQEWDISRDGPYFGFQIPGEENKYFYVWLDAPIGYMAASRKYFESNPSEFDSYWRNNDSEIVHFIGKDILYFHGLFWPAMLMGSEFQTPAKINVHGFMTVAGEKMSKSRGTFVNASTFVKYNNVEHFRFYMAARLSAGLDDVDISFEDFISRVNSDFIGNLVNIVSRVATSILDKLDRRLGKISPEGQNILEKLLESQEDIKKNYEDRNFHKVIREVTSLGDIVNKYVNDKAPWSLIKTDPEAARYVITDALNAAKILFTYIAPVVPTSSQTVAEFLGIKDGLNFLNLKSFIENVNLSNYKPISQRPDEKGIKSMIEETKIEFEKTQENSPTSVSKKVEEKSELKSVSEDGTISIDDLIKVELRVGLITEANHIEGADKLIQVTVDLGEIGKKNVFAGIKAAYKPEDLLNLKVVVVANLKPRKMKFGMSEAMLLASGSGETLSLFIPHREANSGDLLK
ncbi:MAG: methionine--tRNA ligase [Leptospira sp.]|nr:methionine--tRNA ligase [Leptospira sp.]